MQKLSFHILMLALITTVGCATHQPVIKSADAYNNRGRAYYGKGQYDQAISDYNKAIEINPKHAMAYNNRGVACYFKGEYDEAWEDVHKAKSLGSQVHPGFLKALREASGRQK